MRRKSAQKKTNVKVFVGGTPLNRARATVCIYTHTHSREVVYYSAREETQGETEREREKEINDSCCSRDEYEQHLEEEANTTTTNDDDEKKIFLPIRRR